MKPFQSIKLRIQVIVGLLVTALAVGCAVSATRDYQRLRRADRVMAITDVSRDLFAAMNGLRLERGGIDSGIITPPPATEVDMRYRRNLRIRALASLASAQAKLHRLEPEDVRYGQKEIAERRAVVDILRAEAYRQFDRPLAERPPGLADRWMTADTALTDTLSETSARLSAEVGQDDPLIATMMNIGQLAWAARDSAGTKILLEARTLATHRPATVEQLDLLSRLTGRTDAAWALLRREVALHGAPPALQAAMAKADDRYFDKARALEAVILQASIAGRPSNVPIPLERVVDTQALLSLMGVASTAFDVAAARAAEQAAQAERDLYVSIAVMALTVVIGALASLFVTVKVLSPIERITGAMQAVAAGELEVDIPDADRPDEVGDLARALGVFRANAVAKRMADEELLASRVAKEAAEAAARTKAEFLANMSHEIRTPLTGVIGFAGLMARMEDLPARAETYVRRIMVGGQALLSLVNDILDFSRIEAGQVELEPRPTPLAAFLAETLDLVRPEAERKGLALNLELADDLPERVRIDAERVRQVLLNLIGNGVKFTDEGAVTISAAYADEAGGRLLLHVRDTGVGVAAEHGERLFQRFSQIDASNTRRHGGAGLGLAISKGLVEIMGGEIGVDPASGPGGRGATFWFSVSAPREAADEATPEAAADEARGHGPMRILVVDDVAVNRELVSALLSPFDASLCEAANGVEAVAAASSQGFDLILMDLQMPVMDGLAATRAIRASSPLNAATPILAVSANVMAPQVEACMAAGMNDHIAKPIDPGDLFRKIGHWVAAA